MFALFVSSMSCVKQYQFEKWKKKEKENSKCFCTNWPIYCSLELLSSALRWSCIISTRKKQNKKQSPSCLEVILFINLPQCNILPFLPHFCSIKYIYKTEKVIKGFWKKSSKFTGEKASYWTFLNFSCFLIQKKGYKWQKPVKYCTVK